MYVERQIQDRLKLSLAHFPVVLITGPRQAGKSTLLKEQLSHYHYVTLDDSLARELAINDPLLFLSQYKKPLIIDEIQYAPSLLSYIKQIVDENRQEYGQFVLTGSQMFQLMQGVSETLAGRIAIFQLYPFSWHELISSAIGRFQTLDEETLGTQIVQGFYPELCVQDHPDLDLWLSSYITTYIERDIRNIQAITDLSKFQNFISLLATRAGNLLNLSSIAQEAGISQPTAKAWLTLLESTSIIYLLRPYFTNKVKRLVKSPKLYFVDTGLLSYLLGIDNSKRFFKASERGNIFENMIVMDLLKQASSTAGKNELFFYRTSDGSEIDLLVKNKKGLHAIEIKLSKTINPRMAKHLVDFNKVEPCSSLHLASLYEPTISIASNVTACHWSNLLKNEDLY